MGTKEQQTQALRGRAQGPHVIETSIDCNELTMTMTYFSSQQESILRLVTLGSATVSLACSLVVIVTYYLLPHLRTFRNRIVLFICIADIILNISLIGGSFASGSQVACKCFAVMT